MKHNKLLTFESENLVVDWISFNITGPVSIQLIADYLFQVFGFNSTLTKIVNGKWKSEDLNYDIKNQFQVSFRQYKYEPENKSFWDGIKIHFSGNNATQFYNYIRKYQIDWNIFNLQLTSLSRFDLHYFRELKTNEQSKDIEIFMEKCCNRIKTQTKLRNVNWYPNKKGLIMRIGSRKSPNFYRVYQKNNGLEFELELKFQVLIPFQQLLFSNSIDKFEHSLSQHFFERSFESLNLNSSLTDWLLDWYRKIYNKKSGFATSYITTRKLDSFTDKQLLFNLFRFLSFAQEREVSKQYINDQVYYIVTFPVIDFTRYLGLNERSHYQRNKTLQILQTFQTLQPVLDYLDDSYFRSYVIFPYVKIKKGSRLWVATVPISQQLYHYTYPFQFPDYYNTWDNKFQFYIKIQIVQILSATSLKKQFRVEEFLNQFNISNSKKTQLKQTIIPVLQEAINQQLIKPQFKILTKDNSVIKLTKLTTRWINKSRLIYLYETFNYNKLIKPITGLDQLQG